MLETRTARAGLLAPDAKGYYRGTHRTVTPATTVAGLRRFLPVMGITRVANVTGLDNIGIPVVMVCRPNSRGLAVAQGKGVTLDAAQASGLMESIESYHAERIALPLKHGSMEDLRYTHRLAAVDQLPRVPDSRFHAHLPILWIAGQDLLGGGPVWLPYELVHLNFTRAAQVGPPCFVASSNGLAGGNVLLEAISHALCELIERDAYARWKQDAVAEQAATRLDLTTVDDEDCRAILARYAAAAVGVRVWEITSAVGIAAFYCRIRDQQENPLRPLSAGSGLGCHPDRAVALLRALTEAAQSRLTLIAGSRDDCFPHIYKRLDRPEPAAQGAAMAAAGGAGRPFSSVPTWQAATFAADVDWELERLAAAGLQQVLMVDLTRPEFRLPVLHIVIPGLEPLPTEAGVVSVRRDLGQEPPP